MKVLVGSVIGLLVLVGAYLFWPGMSRAATQVADGVQKREMSDNWEFYYDQEIKKMEDRVGEFEKNRESTIAESIKFEGQRDELSAKIGDSQRMIERVAQAWKAAKDGGQTTVDVGGAQRDLASAKEQLATWIEQRKRLEEQLTRLEEAVTRTQAVRKREAAVFQKSKAQVEALKREKVFMRSDLAMKDIENRLRELETVSNAWFETKDLSGLDQVRGVVSEKLLHAEARRQLLAEESNIDKQVGLDDALRNQSAAQANSAVSSELDALLGEDKK